MGLGSSSDNGTPVIIHGRTYRILDIVGQGGEATVYRCKDHRGSQYAMKVFYFSRYPFYQLPQRIDGFHKEGSILKYLSGRSPHFVHMIDYEYKPEENVGYMIMELGDGSLRQYLRGRPLSDRDRRMFWKQIVGILTALEDAKIVHADIKPDNMILVKKVLKITDLGLAFQLASPKLTLQRPAVRGTIDYMAPEVFSHRTGFKSDVWSAGIILYEMTYGSPPYSIFSDRDQKVAAISTMTPIHFPPLTDYNLLDCMRHCLEFDGHYRPTAHRLLSHPYTRE